MSDERDSAGSAGDGDDTADGSDTRGQTAVVTRPQRPTGKRSRRGGDTDTEPVDGDTATDTTSTKNGAGTAAKTAKDGKGPKKGGRNPFLFVWTYLQQVVAELRKVIWPNRKQMVSYTTVVLIFLAFMVTLIGLVDLGLAKLVMLVFG
ncbi:MAG: preprotein translocase subunit SecE [Actinobacteria bacterium]|nr:preprotein translocase subunit SecE [Actinomycetota bacterium]